MEMCGKCMTITGLLVLLTGAAMGAISMKMLDAVLGNQIAGILLILAGLSFIAHGMGMCGACNACCKGKK